MKPASRLASSRNKLYQYMIAISTSLFLSSTPAHANDFESELNTFCEKATSCAIAEMERSLPPELREMAMGMVAGVCDGIKQSYQSVFQSEYSDLVDAATACMQSMNKLNCKQLEEGSGTAECKEFEELSEKYSN